MPVCSHHENGNDDPRVWACYYFSLGYLENIGKKYQHELKTLLVRLHDRERGLSTYWTDIPSLPTMWAVGTAWHYLENSCPPIELIWVRPLHLQTVLDTSPLKLKDMEEIEVLETYQWTPFPVNLNEHLLQQHRAYTNAVSYPFRYPFGKPLPK